MSDPKCATLITVDVPKSGKNNVNKTVRLTINLDESNESKYPELNYKELVNAEERKKCVQNGKTTGLDPFSDNDDDVERVVRKIEQKYGSKSSYARKGRPKKDDFADIGAGYDENDSFIDNTDGYDEMIPPECDTLYGGFYINSGSLEFKMVPQKLDTNNKRRIESSSSEEESSDSSTCESHEDKNKPESTAPKKNKKNDKNKAKKIRRTDSSAATSGKQTSDENAPAGDGESVDSRTSHSDSLTSKPAPSSENALTSDSSRDTEAKSEVKLPTAVCEVLESIEASVDTYSRQHPTAPDKQLLAHCEQLLVRLESTLKQCRVTASINRASWARAAKALKTTRGKLSNSLKRSGDRPPGDKGDKPGEKGGDKERQDQDVSTSTTLAPAAPPTNKRKLDTIEEISYDSLTEQQREEKIVDTLQRLSELIEERKPGMLANYNAECERVQEERKKLQLAAVSEGVAAAERRLPKRRFPWCSRSRALLATLARLAGDPGSAARLLAARALPLFPPGFVRMPTLLRQADLSKEIKASDVKRQRLGSFSQPHPPVSHPLLLATTPPMPPEPIQFPSSLTVTTTLKTSPEKCDTDDKKPKTLFGTIVKSFDLHNDKGPIKPFDMSNDKDLYVPPNNIGSITITPVPSTKDKKPVTDKPGLIRVKSPAALNEMVSKKDVKVIKKQEKPKEKIAPLHIDTSFQTAKKDPSPKENIKKQSPKTKDEITKKQIETMRVAENNIPRPALIPVHHSPTFAKPDKRPEIKKKKDISDEKPDSRPEVTKKKDLIVVSDVDPLSTELLSIDDSSSDSVEVIETDGESAVTSDRSESVSVKKVNVGEEDAIETIMRNIREMAHSQEPTKFTSNSYNGVITTAQSDLP